MSLLDACLLFVAALIAGALNSVAGGGSFLSFPALVFAGVPKIPANATNTVALWPGTIASVGAYRQELGKQRRAIMLLGPISLAGGLAGAILLLLTPAVAFQRLLPYLLLLATLVFILGPRVTAWVRTRSKRAVGMEAMDARPRPRTLVSLGAAQLVISIYGGYFGGGIGILMLAALGLMGMENIHEMNALKTVLTTLINGIAVAAFVVAGKVYWPEALLMIVASIVGGYGGAAYARRLDPKAVRAFVIVVAVSMTAYFFLFQRG